MIRNPYAKRTTNSNNDAMENSNTTTIVTTTNTDQNDEIDIITNVDTKDNVMMETKKDTTIIKVERLPSNQVSFSSAEIVTMTELFHLTTTTTTTTSKSIRVTGKVVGNQSSWILMANDTTISKTKNPYHRPSNVIRSSLIGKKRKLSSNNFESQLSKYPQSVLVYYDVPGFSIIKGNYYMVIGELCNDTDVTTMPKRSNHQSNQPTPQYYVKARLMKNVNGTDMNLYQQALLLRRKYLSSIQPPPTQQHNLADKITHSKTSSVPK